MEIISNMNKSASWFLPVMKEMHHRCSWCSCGESPGKNSTGKEGPVNWINVHLESKNQANSKSGFPCPNGFCIPGSLQSSSGSICGPVKPHVNHTPPMPKNGTVETVRNRRDRSWGLKIAKNWLETIRKISGTISKISGTIWKTSGTVWRISRAILECTNCLANINLQIRMPSEHLQLHPTLI